MKTSAGVLCVLVAVLTGCEGEAFDRSNVIGIEWRLESLQRPDAAVLRVDPGRYTLRLDPDGAAHVRSDCNSCGGRYSLTGSSLTLAALACTRAFCGEASLDQPHVRALQSARSVDGGVDRLLVSGSEGALRYVR